MAFPPHAAGRAGAPVVIAAKSIARWDLARTHAEYFLIGTLSSIGIALMVGMLARQALTV